MVYAATRELLGMIKFSHTLFALPFALLGAAMAAKGPEGWRGRWQDWLGILLCMATARSAAMAFNRLADRRIDALNPRTASRHLPSGRLSTATVAAFTVAQRAGVRGLDPAVPAQPLAADPVGAGPALAPGLLVRQAVHQPGPLLAGVRPGDGPDGRVDRPAGRPGLAPGLAGAGGPALGGGVRHHLCLPGRRFRPRPGPAQRPRPAGRPGGLAAGGGLPRGDGRRAGRARAGLSDGADLLRRASAWSPCCWSTSMRSSGPTT